MENWKNLTETQQLRQLINDSFTQPILLFKHSTSCGISHSAWNRLKEFTSDLAKRFDLYYLDLLRYRNISNQIANELQVIHQSPQVIVIDKGEVMYTSSHYAIKPLSILKVYNAE